MGKSSNYTISPAKTSIHSFDSQTTKEWSEGSIGNDEAKDVSGHYENQHGIHWILCALLIVGEMAGGGLVALPSSMVDAGVYAGVALAIISCIASGYTGIQLGDNWIIMQQRWPQYRHGCRKPYPEMASRSMGRIGNIFMLVIIAVQQYCLAVVFLLLAANNISSIIFTLANTQFNFCYIALIIACVLLPFLMLGSPKDFWQVGVIATCSTTIAIILIFIGAANDQEKCMEEVYYPPVQFEKFFLAYGTIMFAYGGHSCFPTFQHDMRKPYEFSKSVILAYCIVMAMYLPISVYGYIVYGGSLQGGTITPSIQLNWVQIAVNILITIHVMFTQIIIISPLNLTFEELFGIPDKFGIRRVILRIVTMALIVLMALTVPKFGPILDLIGGTTITLMTMILPGVFSICLTAGKRKRDEKIESGIVHRSDEDTDYASPMEIFRYNSKWLLLLNLIIIAFGTIGGVASTISAINELISLKFDLPCYISIFQDGGTPPNSDGLVHCCGRYFNTTTSGISPDGFCAIPEL